MREDHEADADREREEDQEEVLAEITKEEELNEK